MADDSLTRAFDAEEMRAMRGLALIRGRASSRTRRLVQVLLSLLIVVAIFFLVFRRIDFAQVWAEIREMSWIELATIGAIALWNLTTYWAFWMAVLPGLSFGRAMIVTQSGTMVTNTVPGGSAIGVGLAYAMFDSWEFPRSRSTLAVLITGVVNTGMKLALPVLALVLVAFQGDVTTQRLLAGLAGIGLLIATVTLLALAFRSAGMAFRLGEWAARSVSRLAALVHRPAVHGWGSAVVDFRARSQQLLRDRWPAIITLALVSHLSLYLVLLVSLRHVGVSDDEVGWAQVLAVFAFARLVTMIRLTPGGAGIVEATLIAGLVAAGGNRAAVAAAVLVFRALTWLLPVPIGALAYLSWRRQQTRRTSMPVIGTGAG
jgi:putative heme transporter